MCHAKTLERESVGPPSLLTAESFIFYCKTNTHVLETQHKVNVDENILVIGRFHAKTDLSHSGLKLGAILIPSTQSPREITIIGLYKECNIFIR